MPGIIELIGIHKVYHTGEVDVHAVRDVSMSVSPGEFVAIMGASGSGKSTMMNILGCLDRPTKGKYVLDGVDVSSLERDQLATIRNQKIGFVFQGFNLLSRTSARENTELPLLYSRNHIAARDQKERANKALEIVGLGPRGDHHPNQLSGGQQQRVAIARALVNQPAMLLADEPTGNLDTQTSIEIMGVFQRLNDQGITIVMVTHELDIARYTKRNVIMRDGRIVSDSPVTARLNAADELSRLRQAQQAVQIGSMRILATLRIAGRALLRNKMRTILTMLGMIIGVGAVIATVSLGNGAKAQVEAQIAGLGQNVVLVYSGSQNRGGVRSGFFGASTLTVDDATAIAREVPEAIAISPEQRSSAQIAVGNLNWFTQIQGEGETYLDIRQWPLAEGAMFSEQDVRSASKVAIIGKTVADQLFPAGDAVGSVIRVKAAPFTVVGVLTPKGLSVQGQDQDDFIIMPYTSLMKRIQGTTTLRTINISTASPKDLDSVENQVTELLRQRHRTTAGSDDFTVRNQQEIAEAANNASATMRLLLAAVAFVSLVVGGIGIMNIMLVSVTERTREIGIRMAVGAHGADILTQFLTEAVTLSLLGGALGIASGLGGSYLLANYMHWPTLTPVDWIVLSFLVSAAVGVVFGLYPAWKASQLDPIDALRYE